MIQFRPPSMRETTPTGQINELRRYLFQLVEQLNYMAGLEQNKSEAVKIETPADIPGGGGGSGEIPEASEIPYDNAVSGIEADNVQDAIDTIDQMLDGKVDIVAGKGLSTNDYTDGEAQKVLEALTYTAQSLTDAQKQQARDNIGAGAGGGGHTYSTTEQVVGTWIDGKPVYEKSYHHTHSSTLGSGTTTLFPVGSIKIIPNGIRAVLINTSNNKNYPVPWINGSATTSLRTDEYGNLVIVIANDSWGSAYDILITLQYTKTTD